MFLSLNICWHWFLDPGGSKSRRLISQLRGNSSSSGNSFRTVVNCFDIVTQIVLLALVARS